jgi:hypothetical protein
VADPPAIAGDGDRPDVIGVRLEGVQREGRYCGRVSDGEEKTGRLPRAERHLDAVETTGEATPQGFQVGLLPGPGLVEAPETSGLREGLDRW